MKLLICILTITVTSICCVFNAHSQSNSGTEFWTAYMDHVNGAGPGNSSMILYIASNVNTSGKVEVADGSFSAPFAVTANQVTFVAIPASAFIGQQGQFFKGIHITSLKPITVYAHIYAQSISGATLLLPVNTLGKDYYSINYTQISNQGSSYSSLMVIATEDNTTVEITPAAPLLDGTNTKFTVILKKGEVYQGLSNTDLTGTYIRSVSSAVGGCKKIAVFSGSSKIAIGCGVFGDENDTSDNLFQQAYPTASWGKSYVTVPLKSRNYDIFRIVVSDPNTNVKLNGTTIPSTKLINGLYYEFNSQISNVITADKPIEVVQYAVTQGKTINCTSNDNDIGDPEMIYLNPIEQTLSRVTLFSTSNFNILSNYINVVIKTAAVPSFMLDGVPYTTFTSVPGNPLYSYAQIEVAAGTHNIKADDGFNAIAYGFGLAESYGYAAGTNLQNLNKYIVLSDPQKQSQQNNGCIGIDYKLQLTIPYPTTHIKWDFKDGSIPYDDNNPVPIAIIPKGTQTLYTYEYNKTIKRNIAGDYSIVATVSNPGADECGSTEDIEFDYNISDYPVANGEVTGFCLGEATKFTDKSDAKGSILNTWLWDFGDRQTSPEQNPSHTYANPGDYKVSLTIINENGCDAVKLLPDLHINVNPVADFDYPHQKCPGNDITFTDQSTSPDGTITKWIWDFGDGVIETRTNKLPFIHHYTTSGTTNIKLTVSTANGCNSDIKSVQIDLNPTISLPSTITILEGEQVALTPVINDNALKYKWSPSTGLDHDDIQSPAASPIEDTQYTLIATSINDCEATSSVFVKVLKNLIIPNAFTPNGDGINDNWTIGHLESYPSNKVEIYNRYGEKLYSSWGYGIPWDGKYKGAILPTGVYYYIITPGSRRKVIAGNVTIIR